MGTSSWRERLRHSPGWVLFCYYATTFGVLFYFLGVPMSQRSVLGAVLSGTLFGLLMSVREVRQRKDDLASGRNDAERMLVDMLRSGRRPDDAGQRGRLLALITHRRAISRNTRITALIFGILAAASFALTVQDPAWLVLAVLYVAGLTAVLIADRKSRREVSAAEHLLERPDPVMPPG